MLGHTCTDLALLILPQAPQVRVRPRASDLKETFKKGICSCQFPQIDFLQLKVPQTNTLLPVFTEEMVCANFTVTPLC